MNPLLSLVLHAITHPAAQTLGWTLIHFLWQGTALGLLAWLALVLLRHASAKARELEGVIAAANAGDAVARYSVGASAGIAPLSGDVTPGSIIDAADKVMYARKKERRG